MVLRSTQLELLLPECRAYARSICVVREDAEDLVQDAMLRALRTNHKPFNITELRPWLFRVIRNLYNDEMRKLRVRRAYFRHEQICRDDSHQNASQERDIIVRQIFNQLPPDLREVLFLVDVAGLKYNEAAKIVGVPHGTIMSRVSRARRAMFEKMEGNGTPTAKERCPK